MKKILSSLSIFAIVAVFGIVAVQAADFRVNLVTYERFEMKNASLIEKDLNPIFNTGSLIRIEDFGRLSAVASSVQQTQIALNADGETLNYEDSSAFNFATQTGISTVWTGEKFAGKIYDLSDDSTNFELNFNYQFHYASQPVFVASDLLKKGNSIITTSFTQNTSVSKNSVRVLGSTQAKNGNTRYFAVTISN